MRRVVVVLWFLFFLSGCASTPPAGEEIPDDLRAAAEAGEIAAQRVLGELYLAAAEPNPALAAHWLLRAARDGDALAMTELARLYADPSTPVWNPREAAVWFNAAAARGITD